MCTKLLICDLDNTLYDWVAYFVPSIYAMVDKVIEITECDRENLLDDLRSVHRRHHDAENPFSLLETRLVQRIFPGLKRNEIARVLDPAFHAFNSTRKRTLKLYPGVKEALNLITHSGIRVVAHTESKLFVVADRLVRLEIVDFFSKVYCREATRLPDLPPGYNGDRLRKFPFSRAIELSLHQRKPDPLVLKEICSRENVDVSEVLYVGDSMARDIMMAKEASVSSAWARYGAFHDPKLYDMLVRVSHWTKDEVMREKMLAKKAASVVPDFVLDRSFYEIIQVLGIKEGAFVAI
jgi:phosphoglycolate phosphatase